MKNFLFLIFTIFLGSYAFSQQNLPPEIKGNWLNAADSIEWMYSFQPKFAVFDTKFWEYESITRKGNEYKLQLVSGKEEIQLSVKANDSTSLLITVDGKTPIRCTNQKARKPDFRNYDTLEFKEPILVDDTATIIGFIEDYDKAVFPETAKITYYSVLTGFRKGAETEFMIQPDGRFIATFRMFNPQNVWFKIEGSTQTTVFAKPGETLCICFNKVLKEVTADNRKWTGVDDWQINHTMGKSGLLSEELVLLESFVIGRDPTNLIRNNMRDMPQLAYQKWRKQWYVKETHFLDSLYQTMNCSAKARQVMNISEELSLIEDLLVYPFESGTFGQFSQKYIDGLPKSSYSPELNLLYSDYEAFIMYLVNFYSMQTLGGLYPSTIKAYMDFFARHISDTSDLKIINDWKATYAEYSWPELYDRLDQYDRQNDSLLIKNNNSYRNSYLKIIQKYGSIVSENFRDSLFISEFDFVLDKYNSDLTGQMYCVYNLQQFQELKPLSGKYVKWAKQHITSPVLLNYLLETNKTKEIITKKYTTFAAGTHFIDSISSDKNSDDFFTAMLKKFEGKVVYIDFWADWCSPCRAEFEPAAKLKQDYSGKDIVFLYLGISCKKNLWQDMIKEKQIEGFHYWLNKDQGEVMYKKFNFKGIPHFLLVGKTGKVQEGEAPKPSSRAEITERLEELLK